MAPLLGRFLILADQAKTHPARIERARDQGRPFYYRMSKPFFHTLLIRSDILVVHEITNGPFQKGETVFAPFAPDEADALAVSRFQAELGERVAAFTTARR